MRNYKKVYGSIKSMTFTTLTLSDMLDNWRDLETVSMGYRYYIPRDAKLNGL